MSAGMAGRGSLAGDGEVAAEGDIEDGDGARSVRRGGDELTSMAEGAATQQGDGMSRDHVIYKRACIGERNKGE